MSSTSIHSIPIICKIYDLSVVTDQSEQATVTTILRHDEPFSLQISLRFTGTNAIALLGLQPIIQVDFFAKPLQSGASSDLGSVTTTTSLQQMSYQPVLHLGTPAESGLTTATAYRIGALVRIGASDHPALLCGVAEDLIVQIHNP